MSKLSSVFTYQCDVCDTKVESGDDFFPHKWRIVSLKIKEPYMETKDYHVCDKHKGILMGDAHEKNKNVFKVLMGKVGFK
jgi:hypothetical protein